MKVVASLKDLLKDLKADMACCSVGTKDPRCSSTKMKKNYTISAPKTIEYAIEEIGSHSRTRKRSNELLRCLEMEMDVDVHDNEVVQENPWEVEVLDKEVVWENTQDVEELDKEDVDEIDEGVELDNTQEHVILEITHEKHFLENPQPLPPRVEVNEITEEGMNEAEDRGEVTELKIRWWKATEKRLLELHSAGSVKNKGFQVNSQFNQVLRQVETDLKTRMKGLPQKETRLLRSYL